MCTVYPKLLAPNFAKQQTTPLSQFSIPLVMLSSPVCSLCSTKVLPYIKSRLTSNERREKKAISMDKREREAHARGYIIAGEVWRKRRELTFNNMHARDNVDEWNVRCVGAYEARM